MAAQSYAHFSALMDKLRQKYGSQEAVAQLIGMSSGALGRAVKAGTLSFENLLILAFKSGEDPDTVLKLAGKAEQSELLQHLYGQAHQPLSEQDRRLLNLSEEKKRAALLLAHEDPPPLERRPVRRKRAG